MDTNPPFKVKGTKTVYENGLLSVSSDTVVYENGPEKEFTKVTLKPGSSALAINDSGEIYLTKEFRYAINEISVEAVSGGIDKNETPLEAAKRELEEEAGLLADEWIDLGLVHPFTAAIHSPNYMFLAKNLIETEQRLEDSEIIEIIKIPLEEAVQMVMSGKIKHAATCTLILKTEKYLSSKK
ncbi:MAG: NUDIX hydrolase [bacterium]|nr:NUDIX hydrolase [bacterium]